MASGFAFIIIRCRGSRICPWRGLRKWHRTRTLKCRGAMRGKEPAARRLWYGVGARDSRAGGRRAGHCRVRMAGVETHAPAPIASRIATCAEPANGPHTPWRGMRMTY
jgi:hypothetical protein